MLTLSVVWAFAAVIAWGLYESRASVFCLTIALTLLAMRFLP